MIFLIFVFVFREASSLFIPKKFVEAPSLSATSSPNAEMVPETYGEEPAVAETPTSGEEGAPGQFIYSPKNPHYPEIYNPDTGLLPADIDVVPADPEAEAPPVQIGLTENLTSNVWQPVGEVPKFGIIPLLIGTAKTTIIAILIGAPLGILAALYVAFFAKRWVREIVKPAIELLAGFPSVVIGFFCLVTVASFVQDITGLPYRLNAIVGGIGLSLAVIPIVFSIAEDALSSVPKSLHEASLALGSTEWQTAYRVMLPAAAPGVFAAVLLGVGRAFGETMIAIMATGNAPLSSWSPFEPARTVAATIGSEMGEVVWGSEHYGVLFFLGVLLFVVSFGLNAITELYVKKRFIKRFQGQ
ncbi:MAG: phosphate ABC transporter permease subunit PstC [Candidatus Kapabacteria bacterium]|nr:phosphate ABC transporter permease subunit PstC [Candidatus Kapabacteria bacterium]